MKARVSCLLATTMAAVALLGSCRMGSSSAESFEPVDTIYTVTTDEMTHGSVTPVPNEGAIGTTVKLIVNPDPGYKLAGLQFHIQGISNLDGSNQTSVNQNSQRIYRFEMPSGGAWVSATFKLVGTTERSVSLSTGEHGQVLATPVSGVAGTAVRLYSYIDSGYAFKTGYPKLANATWVSGREGYEFTIDGTGNVAVTTEFEASRDASSLVAKAEAAMQATEYDTAFGYYEAAYQVDSSNAEAIFYSTLGKLLSIPCDSHVRTLLRKPGMQSTSIPGTISDWLNLNTASSTNWLAGYADDDGTVYKLPRLGPPNGFPGSFLNYSVYQNNAGKRKVFDILLLWNMLGNNQSGFNDFVDDTLKYAFGEEFEAAASRAASLPASASVTLDPGLGAVLGLDGLYGQGSATVGRAELDVLFGSLRSVKALFELAQSYNLGASLQPMLIEVGYADDFNDLLAKMIAAAQYQIGVNGNNSSLTWILPLRSYFMKLRYAGGASAAKADMQAAVDAIDGSLDAFYGRFDAEAKAKYAWLQGSGGFVRKLKAAMDTGGTLYLPQVAQYKTLFDAMEGQGSWISDSAGYLGINLGNLFSPGYLAANKMIVCKPSGEAPIFYGFASGTAAGAAIGSVEAASGFDTFSLELGEHFKGLFPRFKGIDAAQYKWTYSLFPDLFPQTGGSVSTAKKNVINLFNLYQAR